MWRQEGDVLAWNVSHVIMALREHPIGWLLNKRATNLLSPQNHNLDVRAIAWDSLIDDWFCYTINSFQDVIISGFDVRRMCPKELAWCNLQQKARSELWSVTRRLGLEYAGTMVNYARAGGVIYLYAQTN